MKVMLVFGTRRLLRRLAGFAIVVVFVIVLLHAGFSITRHSEDSLQSAQRAVQPVEHALQRALGSSATRVLNRESPSQPLRCVAIAPLAFAWTTCRKRLRTSRPTACCPPVVTAPGPPRSTLTSIVVLGSMADACQLRARPARSLVKLRRLGRRSSGGPPAWAGGHDGPLQWRRFPTASSADR